MKRFFAAMMLALLAPACASAAYMNMTEMTEPKSGSRMVIFSVKPDTIDVEPGKETVPDEAQLSIWAKIEERFRQGEVIKATGRGMLTQTGSLWQDEKTASMGLIWQGEQADGMEGCMGAGLTVDLETGEEILLEQLFEDYDGALGEMERILEEDVLDTMSDYMEYADLLPMPTDSYSFSERGLTVYWPEDRYRYFDGTSGSVTFYWHEIADYIGEGSPAYALAHPDVSYNPSGIESLCMSGAVSPLLAVELGELLGGLAQAYPLADPDYTTDALVYPLERERGFAVEIPKYAETDEDDTPVSAVRASRISLAGLLTTGKSTDADVIALLGEPAMEKVYDEDAAFDAMLDPGRSLYYELSGRVLQLHADEQGVLACVILRDAMPESLY
ncbi:MAG: hypothetical protein IJO02_07505 [Clostridia bacterium]|nr:hypothetical protein [Clostridia bacterium]